MLAVNRNNWGPRTAGVAVLEVERKSEISDNVAFDCVREFEGSYYAKLQGGRLLDEKGSARQAEVVRLTGPPLGPIQLNPTLCLTQGFEAGKRWCLASL